MKSVLISIQPKWCEIIASGKKTIEVRKTRPKIETPFKCYIYCTKPKERLVEIIKDGDEIYGDTYRGKPLFIETTEGSVLDAYGKWKKVIGEFVCDGFDEFTPTENGIAFKRFSALHRTCLSVAEIREYLCGKIGYGWHISDLKIYDKPRELSEFWAYNEGLHKRYDADEDFCCYDARNEYGEAMTDCGNAYENILNCYHCWEEYSGWCHRVKRPPQDWMFVEEV